jgi:hypothetical protein
MLLLKRTSLELNDRQNAVEEKKKMKNFDTDRKFWDSILSGQDSTIVSQLRNDIDLGLFHVFL